MTGSWKTTSAGIAMIVGAIIGFIFAIKAGSLDEAKAVALSTALLGGVGLIFAKDGNVTGGTVSNGQTPN